MTAAPGRAWVGMFVVAVFLVGVGAGALVTPWLAPGPRTGPGPPGGRGGPPARMLLERLSSEMELTDDQRVRLEQLFETRRQRFREVNREVRARFETEQADFRTAIADILTAAQLEVFEEEIVRLGNERRPPRRDRRFGPGPPGRERGRAPRR